MAKPECVTIKKYIEVEEIYTMITCSVSTSTLEKGLRAGLFNLVQSSTVEPHVWVVNVQGKRVALLEKDGGCGPDERCEVEVR